VTVTFNRDIAPVLYAHCATCHRPGEVGPFSLLTYNDARQHATQIVDVTRRRLMPPWKPVRGSADFIGDRSLSDADIALFARWVADGAAEGAPADLPPPPALTNAGEWQLGSPDLVVTMPAAFSVPASSSSGDVFRTFVISVPTTAPKYVRGLEFRPGNPRVVHHANIAIDRTGSSRQLDAQDPEPGYAGGMVPDASYPPGYMLGWTPGQRPRPSPDGMPWRLDPGSDLVVQVHLQPTGKPELLQVSAAFYFTDDLPVRVPVGLRMGSETIDIPAEAEHTIRDSYTVPVDTELFALQPHAHNLARSVFASATRPDGSTTTLIAIDDWDFRWQDVYRFVRPVALPKGTTISMRITYDNSSGNPRNASRPPRPVVWGPNTSDEMGDLWLQLVPVRDAERAVLDNDIARKMSAEDLAAYTKLMNAEPRNPLRHDTVAMLHFRAGQFDRAVAEYRASLALNNQSAPTHYNLGLVLSVQQQYAAAIAEFGEAIRIDPDYVEAHTNLAAILLLNGRMPEAIEHFMASVRLAPDNTQAHDNLARGLAAIGRRADAVNEFAVASRLRPDWAPPVTGAAWLRVTSVDAAVRNVEDGVQLAERAAEMTGRRDPMALDALGAAYAAAGRFADAVSAAKAALALARAARNPQLEAQIQQRQALYERGEAYVER
jgi:tetratricopeptide (TPR) repeat protein